MSKKQVNHLKFNPLGSEFVEGHVVLKVMECIGGPASCMGCWYDERKDKNHRNYTGSCFIHGHSCTAAVRKDNKQVIFKYQRDV